MRTVTSTVEAVHLRKLVPVCFRLCRVTTTFARSWVRHSRRNDEGRVGHSLGQRESGFVHFPGECLQVPLITKRDVNDAVVIGLDDLLCVVWNDVEVGTDRSTKDCCCKQAGDKSVRFCSLELDNVGRSHG